MSDDIDRAQRLATMREAMDNGRRMLELIQPVVTVFPAAMAFLANAYQTTVAADAADVDYEKAVKSKQDAQNDAAQAQQDYESAVAKLHSDYADVMRELDAKRQDAARELKDFLDCGAESKSQLLNQISDLTKELAEKTKFAAMTEADMQRQHQDKMDVLQAERDQVQAQIDALVNELAAIKARLG